MSFNVNLAVVCVCCAAMSVMLSFAARDAEREPQKFETEETVIQSFDTGETAGEETEPEEQESVFEEEETVDDLYENAVYLGSFRTTAYCSCEKCCGKYAKNRPKDADGNDIVYGASGMRLYSDESVAVDTSVIPFGSRLLIDGNVYIAADRGGAIKGKKLDIYFDTHEQAWNYGMKYRDVYLLEDEE